MLGFSSNLFAEDKKEATAEEKTTSSKPATHKVEKKAKSEEKTSETKETKTEENVVEKTPAPAKKKFTPSTPFTGVHSLRGESELIAPAEATHTKQSPSDRPPIARNYFQQPPLVPHRIRGYKITINNNKCMSCHSWKNYKKARATKVSQTHFADRDGNAQSTLAARRYFCNQCHVPQVDAKPLIENSFKPVSQLK
ncbi:MAG: nitrate reductase cytochrome c-type subunit [Thiotrichaceae bacterium]|nr:nitrate reductase cytochrome c-type subunit [Thiotrichaceae bacterium]